MSDSVWPQRRQPTRCRHPWDSPGKNTGVGCHFLLQCMQVKSKSEVTQSCLTHRNPMDCSLPGSSVHGIFQARVLEWVAIAFSDPLDYNMPNSLSSTISWSLLRFMSIESVMLSNHLILCHHLLLCLQSFPASASFPVSCFFTSGSQSIGASVSASVLSMKTQV